MRLVVHHLLLIATSAAVTTMTSLPFLFSSFFLDLSHQTRAGSDDLTSSNWIEGCITFALIPT